VDPLTQQPDIPALLLLARDYRFLLTYVVPVGVVLGTLVFTLVTLLYRFLKQQTQNGDGRSLQMALDDLSLDFKQHRQEMRGELNSLHMALSELFDRVSTVEKAKAAGGEIETQEFDNGSPVWPSDDQWFGRH
jgi:hypothetical protein